MKTFSIVSMMRRISFFVILYLAFVVILSSTGCTVLHNGMTLPNGSYLKDTVEYYPHGPRYQFSNEASHLQSAKSDQNNGIK
ncbi:MAG: hypothetical protein LBP59_12235 [Planctomycetaceae bacterium]|jgi:hypothetical protein|nr:hypothetical protein [Planctomycetaceae bacterium]